MNPLNSVVLGCTGLVGRRFVHRLACHPWFKLTGLAASSRSAGLDFGDLQQTPGDTLPKGILAMRIHDLDDLDNLCRDAKIAFCALPGRIAEPLEPALRQRGLRVFTNAASHRMDPDIPILIPEVNPDHLELARAQTRLEGGAIVTNANCVTAGLTMTLAPLVSLGLARVHLVTCQALSGAGQKGPRAIAMQANVLPYIEGEEEKITQETRRILGSLESGQIRPRQIDISVTCCRVPVIHGHLLHVTAEMAAPVNTEEVRQALASFKGRPQALRLPSAPPSPLIVRQEPDRPQPRLDVNAGGPGAGSGMAVTIGRLRVQGNRILFTALVHNLERGAAGTSILNAELAVKQRLIPGAELAGGSP